MDKDQQTITEALLLVIDRVARMHAKAEEAMNLATACRTALVALAEELEVKDPALAKTFRDFSGRLLAVAARHSADPPLDEIQRQLSELLPK